MKKVADMVFGFGEGKIELTLDKTNVKFGDAINGTLMLTLHSMKHARALRVSIYAERLSTHTSHSGGRSRTTTKCEKVYSKDTILDGEKDYLTGIQEYKFQVQVPGKDEFAPQIAKQFVEGIAPKGFIGDALKAMSAVSRATHPIKWFVSASLDIPGGFDVSNRVQISVGE